MDSHHRTLRHIRHRVGVNRKGLKGRVNWLALWNQSCMELHALSGNEMYLRHMIGGRHA